MFSDDNDDDDNYTVTGIRETGIFARARTGRYFRMQDARRGSFKFQIFQMTSRRASVVVRRPTDVRNNNISSRTKPQNETIYPPLLTKAYTSRDSKLIAVFVHHEYSAAYTHIALSKKSFDVGRRLTWSRFCDFCDYQYVQVSCASIRSNIKPP